MLSYLLGRPLEEASYLEGKAALHLTCPEVQVQVGTQGQVETVVELEKKGKRVSHLGRRPHERYLRPPTPPNGGGAPNGGGPPLPRCCGPKPKPPGGGPPLDSYEAVIWSIMLCALSCPSAAFCYCRINKMDWDRIHRNVHA